MILQTLPARAVTGLLLAASVASMTGAGAQAATAPPGVTFATSVSTVHGALPLFRLDRIPAPTSFVESVLGKSQQLGVEKSLLVARDSNNVVKAYVDGRSGDAQIFPDLSAGGTAVRGTAQRVASTVFGRSDIIPKDATTVRLGAATPVFSAQVARSGNGATQPKGEAHKLFTYFQLARTAAGLPVVGAGSAATLGVADDGTIRGFVRRWQTASLAGMVAATTSAAQVTQSIRAQLRPLENPSTSITVDSVKPVYFDGHAKYLQPAYMFLATLHARSGLTANEHVRGYVPVGRLVEPLPVIGQHNGSAPGAPHQGGAQGNVSQISLGEYANRDGTMQDMANAYLNGFDSVPPWWFGPPIVRTQWYWAYPYEVESSSQWYLNAVNVAYTMPHGDWYLNTTYSNYGDLWYVNQIGTGGNLGYGAATGGQLATWIIDSCEVAPAYYDLQVTTGNGYNAFNYWWPVFQGLHRVLAFRTQMLLGEDTMNYNIAQSMALGANANSAFFNGVAAGYFPWTYLDSHLNQYVHYDRASLFYDPRNANESIYSVQGQSASGQLSNVWMGN